MIETTVITPFLSLTVDGAQEEEKTSDQVLEDTRDSKFLL